MKIRRGEIWKDRRAWRRLGELVKWQKSWVKQRLSSSNRVSRVVNYWLGYIWLRKKHVQEKRHINTYKKHIPTVCVYISYLACQNKHDTGSSIHFLIVSLFFLMHQWGGLVFLPSSFALMQFISLPLLVCTVSLFSFSDVTWCIIWVFLFYKVRKMIVSRWISSSPTPRNNTRHHTLS